MNLRRLAVPLVALVGLLAMFSIALAQGVAPIDPLHPIAAERTVVELVEHYGLPWGLMFVAVGVGSWFVARNEKEHWLNDGAGGRALHLIAGLVGAAGAVLDVRFNGGSWGSVYAYLPGVLALVWQKPEAGSKSTSSPSAGLGSVMIVFAVGATIASCGATAAAIARDARSCAVAAAGSTYDAIVKDVEVVLLSGGSGWRQELDALRSGAESAGVAGGASAIVCAVSAARDELMALARAKVGAGAGSSPEAAGAARADDWLAGR